MRVDTALLLCAAIVVQSASAAARGDILRFRGKRFYPSANGTLSTSPPTLLPSTTTARQQSSPSLTASTTANATSIDKAPPLSASTSSDLASAYSSASTNSSAATTSSRSSNVQDLTAITSGGSAQQISPSSPPSSWPTNATTTSSPHSLGSVVTITIECPTNAAASLCTGPSTRVENVTISHTGPTATATDKCTSLPDDGTKLVTEFSVVYTSTITFYGNRADYTPPFETLVTPNYCVTPWIFTELSPGKMLPSTSLSGTTTRRLRSKHVSPYHITFITTDKNPSVVFPTEPVPAYTVTGSPGGAGGNPDNANHKTADSGGRQGEDPGWGSLQGATSQGSSHPTPDAGSVSKGALPTFKVTARGTQVIINDQTFSDMEPGQTSVVTVGGGTFTIYPTAILGEGATFQKPSPAATAVSIATPTSGIVGGLAVTITGSEAIVGGATMTIPEGGTATVVNGRQVSIGPGTLVVGGEILSFDPVMPARETEVMINGGELLTAIGRSVVVIHSTTFTYGPNIPETTEVVNGETISIGPSGVVVHGMVVGGPSADASTTAYEIVGGATISRIAPSIAVINGVTFTVGPGTHWTTTEIAGELFTIGPTGILVSTMTLTYPFGSVVTTSIVPTGTWLNDFPVETAGLHTEEGNTGSLLRPDMCLGGVAVGIAIGVLFLG